MGDPMTTTTLVPAMFGLPLAIRRDATCSRDLKRHIAEEIRDRVVVTQTLYGMNRTEINGWIKLGEPIAHELIPLFFSSCDFGARVTVTDAEDGSATFQVVIFGSD